MVAGLAFLYGSSDDVKKKEIDNFIEDNIFYSHMSIDELLSFDKSKGVIDGIEIDMVYKNGKEAIETIIDDFKNIFKL